MRWEEIMLYTVWMLEQTYYDDCMSTTKRHHACMTTLQRDALK
jgi:hypothetical protein